MDVQYMQIGELWELFSQYSNINLNSISVKMFTQNENEITYTGQNYTLIDDSSIWYYLAEKYLNFYTKLANISTMTDMNKCLNFKFKWDQFLSKNLNNIQMRYNALMMEYSPIENTSAYIKQTTEYKGSESNAKQGSESHETSYTGTETNGKGSTLTDTYEVSADNASTYSPANKDTQAWTGSDTKSFTNRKDTLTDTYTNRAYVKSFTDRADEYTEHRHGNIGVTTNTQMINEVLQTYTRQLAYDIIDEFARLYLFL